MGKGNPNPAHQVGVELGVGTHNLYRPMSNHASLACGEGTAMAETRKLAAFLRRMWSDSASLPGPTRSGHLPASERCEAI